MSQSLLIGIIVIVVASVAASVAIPVLVFGRLAAGTRARNNLLATGTPAQARILQIEDTGVTVNDNPRVCVTMEVYPSNGMPTYQAQSAFLVSRLRVSQIQPGMMVQVRVDPSNPNNVAVALA